MLSYKRNILFIPVVAIAVLAVIAQSALCSVLDSREILRLQGSCSCWRSIKCNQCVSDGGGIHHYCTATPFYDYCDDKTTLAKNKDCGSCTSWMNCGTYKECTGSGCTSCITTGPCNGCNNWTGDSCF